MKFKAFIGVGHGGKDSGAVGNGLKEKDIVLNVALELNRILKNHGINTLMSRERDEEDTIQEEVREENKFNSDVAIDVHINAGGGDGFEVFHHHKGGRGKILAQNIEREVVAIGQNSRGCKTKVNSSGRDYYMFIRETKGSAVIVECAFIDTNDIYCIDELHEQKNFGRAIAKGVLKTLNISFKDDLSSNEGQSTPSSDYLYYRVVVGSYRDEVNANNMLTKLKNNGYGAFIAYENNHYRVIAGSYSKKSNADKLKNELINKGYKDTFIVIHKS